MNSRIFHSPRSTEAPMDFQFTSGQKRRLLGNQTTIQAHRENVVQQLHHLSVSAQTETSLSFFATPSRQAPEPYSWAPPPSGSPATLFPPPSFPNEVKTPPKSEEHKKFQVYRARHKTPRGTKLRMHDRDMEDDDDDDPNASDDDHINHYTLNVAPTSCPTSSDTPYILLGYLQFFFNLSLISVFLYLLLQFILTVQRDVEHRISEYSMDSVQEIARCALQYRNNYCDKPAMLAPALVHQCGEWETCMNRDPTKSGVLVVNGFVEPISWKTLTFTLTSLSFLTVFINTPYITLPIRHRTSHEAHQPQPPLHLPILNAPPYDTHQYGVYQTPTATPGWTRNWKGNNDDDQTPSARRRRLGKWYFRKS
ncbi:Di-sulfide bridge nucleocytoplasmic transport domain-containing protein [Lentinula raphanica]|nr:Di-sulfide bridge nucleocytoplasmic transport domain-containing protein [Lentinula raphanica]